MFEFAVIVLLPHEHNTAAWTPASAIPNCVSVFMDPFWEGAFCRASVFMRDANAVVFIVHLPHKPVQLTSLEKMRPRSRGVSTMCSSVKLHIFNDHTGRLDFLYSTAFPIETLSGMGGGLYDVFNYNIGSGTAVAGVSVCIIPFLSTFRPDTAALLRIDTPMQYDYAMDLSNWMRSTIETLSPASKSVLMRMHTFGRDRCSMILFQDLHTFLSRGTLPPALAIYAICNASIVNQIELTASFDTISMPQILDMLRDTCACFTMCHYEGIYWPDISCGALVEDQPHPFSSVEPCNGSVFRRDDCEGRASQVQCMARLLQSMAELAQTEALFVLLKRQQTCGEVPLNLNDTMLRNALNACLFLGNMLLSKKCELHITVGHACFNKVTNPASVAPPTAHSFSFATDMYKNHRIVDSTGWERLDNRHSAAAAAAIVHDVAQDATVRPCLVFDMEQENELYSMIAIGHDHIYFSKSSYDSDEIVFGTTLTSMRNNGLHTIKSAAETALCFRITTRDFLQALTHTATPKWRRADGIEGAERMLQIYDYMQNQLPKLRRLTRPPPVSEDNILKLMKATWATIDDSTMAGNYNNTATYTRISTTEAVPACKKSHKFMRSHINLFEQC